MKESTETRALWEGLEPIVQLLRGGHNVADGS